MKVLPGDLRQPVQDGLGRVEVGEALGEVDRAVLVGDAGHAADHRVGEAGGAGGKTLHGGVLQYFIKYSNMRIWGIVAFDGVAVNEWGFLGSVLSRIL